MVYYKHIIACETILTQHHNNTHYYYYDDGVCDLLS